MCLPLQKCGTCAAYIIYAICFCAALILRTCEPHSAYVQNVRHKQNIGHMRKMCAGGIHCNMCAVCAQSSRYVQNMRSLRTILKICAQYVQFAHIIKKKKKKKKVQHQLLATLPSTGQAQCSSTGAFNVVWSQTPTAIQEDLLYVQLHCLK